MKQIKSEKITAIKKRFNREWLLIDIDVMDESTTTPISGRLIAHAPKAEKLYKILLKSPQIKRPLIECSADTFPRGVVAGF